MQSRKHLALEGRIAAAKLAYDRIHPEHYANGDELKYRFDRDDELPERQSKPSHIANYTKGLPHQEADGLLCDPADYQKFIQGIDSANPRDFQDTPLGPKGDGECDRINWKSQYTQTADQKQRVRQTEGNRAVTGIPVRAWESAGAGHVFDLQGPDAQSVTMPPAPTFESEEFAAEVAEVYEMALLRDVPFAQFDSHSKVAGSLTRLNDLDWFKGTSLNLSGAANARRRGSLTTQNAFRGTSIGDTAGPYISQFLVLGTPELGDENNPNNLLDGNISYGAMRFDNRVRVASERDYMTTWKWWLDVQNGADLRGLETYENVDKYNNNKYRFIATPARFGYLRSLRRPLSGLSQRLPVYAVVQGSLRSWHSFSGQRSPGSSARLCPLWRTSHFVSGYRSGHSCAQSRALPKVQHSPPPSPRGRSRTYS